MVINDTSITKTALIFFLVGLLCGGVIGFGVGRGTAEKGADGKIITTDTITRYDTLFVKSPTARDSIVVKYITKTLPSSKQKKNDTFLAENSRTAVLRLHSAEHVQAQLCSRLHEDVAQNNGENIPPQEMSDERDSMAVEIPITQKRYDGENYSAWVSGYEPSLDSIFVSQRTDVVTIREKKPPNKWHIGVQCGVGYTFKSKQFEPFIGVGLSYSIISF